MDALKKVQIKSEELVQLMTTCNALGIEIDLDVPTRVARPAPPVKLVGTRGRANG